MIVFHVSYIWTSAVIGCLIIRQVLVYVEIKGIGLILKWTTISEMHMNEQLLTHRSENRTPNSQWFEYPVF